MFGFGSFAEAAFSEDPSVRDNGISFSFSFSFSVSAVIVRESETVVGPMFCIEDIMPSLKTPSGSDIQGGFEFFSTSSRTAFSRSPMGNQFIVSPTGSLSLDSSSDMLFDFFKEYPAHVGGTLGSYSSICVSFEQSSVGSRKFLVDSHMQDQFTLSSSGGNDTNSRSDFEHVFLSDQIGSLKRFAGSTLDNSFEVSSVKGNRLTESSSGSAFSFELDQLTTKFTGGYSCMESSFELDIFVYTRVGNPKVTSWGGVGTQPKSQVWRNIGGRC